MANLAIKGHAKLGSEVIALLEMLGGINSHNLYGDDSYAYYTIDSDKEIKGCIYMFVDEDLLSFSLEQFEEQFPYKVGDRVKTPNCDVACRVTNMIWNGIEIEYETTNSEETFFADELQPYKKETMDKVNKAVFDANAQCCDIMNHLIKEESMEEIIKIDIPKGYEFAGVDDDNQQVVFTKIQTKYPKTHLECCDVLGRTLPINDDVEGHKWELIMNFQRLLVCRDAYWKIAGEQMGLGKPWEPDWKDSNFKYCLKKIGDNIEKSSEMTISCILAFPTEEMRDTFLENFGHLIEICKELL